MTVLIVTYLSASSPSGVVTYTQTLTRDLARKQIGVQLIDAGHTPVYYRLFLGLLKRILRSLGGIFHVIYDEFAYFTGLYLATRRLDSASIDLIHAQDARSGAAAFLALGRRVPVVLTCHFNDDPVTELATSFSLSARSTRWLSRWYTYLFSLIQRYVFVSRYAYEKSKHFLPKSAIWEIIHNAVSVDLPKTTAKQTNLLTISNVGYIDERKNQKLLLEIGCEFVQRGLTNFVIWFVGDGPRRAEYEALAAQLQLSRHVVFYGRQTAPWKLVSQSDLYVHTSLNDNCPYSIVEAFAVRTPVLALPTGGIPEMLPAGYGLLQATTVSDLATEIIGYLDEATREQLASRQAAFATLWFNHAVNLEKLISFYQQTVDSQKEVTAAYSLVTR